MPMDERRAVRISKYLALHLRHRPERIGLVLGRGGWAGVAELLAACARHGFPLTRAELEHVVAVDGKKRYVLDGDRIRAVQGHSIPVDLDLPPVPPPDLLYHGTVRRSVEPILRDGLLPMGRHAVHLSPDRETARRVGAARRTRRPRRGGRADGRRRARVPRQRERRVADRPRPAGTSSRMTSAAAQSGTCRTHSGPPAGPNRYRWGTIPRIARCTSSRSSIMWVMPSSRQW